MRIYKILSLVCLCAILCISCNNQITMRQLNHIETYIDSNPQSVIEALDSIEINELHGKEKAMCALLYTQAQDKSCIDVIDDSLIHIATTYFSRSNDEYHKMLSFYYLARVQYNKRSYAHSIVSASRAEEAAAKINNNYYLGLIYRCMSECFNKTYNATEELRYIKMARDCFEQAGYAIHERYARLNIAKAYMCNRKFDVAKQICESCLNDSIAIQNMDFRIYNLQLYANAFMFNGEFSKAKDILNKLAVMPKYQPKIDDYCHFARIYNREEKRDSTLLYLKKAQKLAQSQTDSVYIFRALYEMALSNKDTEAALINHQKIISLQDSVTRAMLQQSITTFHRDYYRNEAQFISERAARNKCFYIICLFCLLAISTFAILYYREGNKRKKEELAHTMESVQEMLHTIKYKDKDLTNIQQQVEHLFNKQFAMLDGLTNAYLDHKAIGCKSSTIILNKVEKIVYELSDPKKQSELEDIVNKSKHNIVTRIRHQIPNIKEREILVFLYCCAQMSARSIALFMNEKLANIYNIKSRFKGKIIHSQAPDKEEFLNKLS